MINFRHTIWPIIALTFFPLAAPFLHYINKNQNVLNCNQFSCMSTLIGSETSWKIVIIYSILQLLMMKILPGKFILGPTTTTGYSPKYRDNGIFAFFLTIIIFIFGSHLGYYSLTILYDHFGEILGTLSVLSLFICLILYYKGWYYPTSQDVGSSGNFIFDYYWGMELHPLIFGWDIKMFTNCRFGMMSWGPILISCLAKQSELYGVQDSLIISACLQFVYITKFFIWESGYMSSTDIIHDRAGFYICWGCIVWIPTLYTSTGMYLVNNRKNLGFGTSSILLLVGSLSIIINYLADLQKQLTRKTNGNCIIWGKKPNFIRAFYKTKNGEEKENLLLLSGWWGISRHFHYLPELAGTLCWSFPAGFDNVIPYLYFIFLTILLLHRILRQEELCYNKYNKYWEMYCDKVRYKLIPGIY